MAMWAAIKDGKIKEIRSLLSGGQLGVAAKNNGLLLASLEGKVEIVDLLLASGASANAVEEGTRLTPLHRGAGIDIKGESGATALVFASQMGHVETVRLLVDRGAKINNPTSNGTTPLMVASVRGRLQIVRMLIKSGADLSRMNDQKQTALFLAAVQGHTDVVEALAAGDAPIDQLCEGNGATALMAACGMGCLDVVKVLLEAGADVTAKNQDGNDALRYALKLNRVEVANLLVEKLRGGRAATAGTQPASVAEASTDAAKLSADFGALTVRGRGVAGVDDAGGGSGGGDGGGKEHDQECDDDEAALARIRKVKECSNCGKKGESVKLCNGCHRVPFCSADCLKAAWSTHKVACKKRQKELKKQTQQSKPQQTEKKQEDGSDRKVDKGG